MQRFSCVIALVAVLACGGSTGDVIEPMLPLTVAGAYPTTVAITSDACGGSVVQDNPTTVTQSAGANALSLSHAGSVYAGTALAASRIQHTTAMSEYCPARIGRNSSERQFPRAIIRGSRSTLGANALCCSADPVDRSTEGRRLQTSGNGMVCAGTRSLRRPPRTDRQSVLSHRLPFHSHESPEVGGVRSRRVSSADTHRTLEPSQHIAVYRMLRATRLEAALRSTRLTTTVFIFAGVLGCRSSKGDPIVPTPQLSVAGAYPTTVALTSDACGGSVVQDNPTTVTHVAGATTLSLSHAGSVYSGSVQTNGQFSTTPATAVIGSASYVVAMSGQFTVTGFASTVTVDKTDAAHPSGCRYVVAWTATRSSGQNVIPG